MCDGDNAGVKLDTAIRGRNRLATVLGGEGDGTADAACTGSLCKHNGTIGIPEGRAHVGSHAAPGQAVDA